MNIYFSFPLTFEPTWTYTQPLLNVNYCSVIPNMGHRLSKQIKSIWGTSAAVTEVPDQTIAPTAEPAPTSEHAQFVEEPAQANPEDAKS